MARYILMPKCPSINWDTTCRLPRRRWPSLAGGSIPRPSEPWRSICNPLAPPSLSFEILIALILFIHTHIIRHNLPLKVEPDCGIETDGEAFWSRFRSVWPWLMATLEGLLGLGAGQDLHPWRKQFGEDEILSFDVFDSLTLWHVVSVFMFVFHTFVFFYIRRWLF